MNIKVTIEVEGETADVEEWLSRFGLGQVATAERPAYSIGRDGRVQWTPELADRLLERITDLARMALWYMATNAPEISFSDLQEEMKLDGIRLGGVLASFGFAKNAGLPRPYRVDRERRRYHMDPEVAEVMIDAVRRYEGDEENSLNRNPRASRTST